MKDYYKLLELSPEATEDQVRKAYRRLALQYHPDRNPDNSKAEEQFKEVAEAYGVLTDPTKRARYDQARTSGFRQQNGQGGFGYSQEDIFRDLFQDPRFSQGLQEIFKEFEKAGMRFDQQFFKQTFFSGRGMIFGGVFMWGPFGSSTRTNINRPADRANLKGSTHDQIKPSALLKQIGGKLLSIFTGTQNAIPLSTDSATVDDIIYNLTISREEAQKGTWVKIITEPGHGRQETLKVKIPPQTKDNSRLRLKNKGRHTDTGRGDLYLIVHLEETN